MNHYIYDASGERVLKANSNVTEVYENGSLIPTSNIRFCLFLLEQEQLNALYHRLTEFGESHI
jgi:hypothetical protein